MSRTRVARAFAGASDYDRHARVQRLVARDLARRIAALPIARDLRGIEVGCGTGFLTQALQRQGLGGAWRITDLAPAMVERARTRMEALQGESDHGPTLTFAAFDGEHGKPEAGPFDLICASLSTQWFEDEAAALARWHDWLVPGGRIMVATLGPGTFAQWRQAHEEEGFLAGTPPFTSLDRFAAIDPSAQVDVARYHERHADAPGFLRSLRAIGAHTAPAGHHALNAGAFRRVMRRFEADGAVVTYEVVTCHLARANPSA